MISVLRAHHVFPERWECREKLAIACRYERLGPAPSLTLDMTYSECERWRKSGSREDKDAVSLKDREVG